MLMLVSNSFHPAIQKVKALLDSGVVGKLKGLEAELGFPGIAFASDDIRYNYALGGGATMDLGCTLHQNLLILIGSTSELDIYP